MLIDRAEGAAELERDEGACDDERDALESVLDCCLWRVDDRLELAECTSGGKSRSDGGEGSRVTRQFRRFAEAGTAMLADLACGCPSCTMDLGES